MAKKKPIFQHLTFALLTPFYDTVARWPTPETRFKRQLVERAGRPHDGRRAGDGTIAIQS